MEELVKRYNELYDEMSKSGNPEKMIIFGESERWAFHKMIEVSPKTAQQWLDKLEAVHWNNYLSKDEAMEVASNLVNQNGSKGAHWSYETFKSAVESLGGEVFESPFFNCYALWATAVMIYSDHAKSISEDLGYKQPSEVPNEKMALSIYKKAIEKLKDVDRPKFVREYFREFL